MLVTLLYVAVVNMPPLTASCCVWTFGEGQDLQSACDMQVAAILHGEPEMEECKVTLEVFCLPLQRVGHLPGLSGYISLNHVLVIVGGPQALVHLGPSYSLPMAHNG